MSTFECPLTTFELSKHANADSLSIAQVGGWQCVVRTSDFIGETLGVYLPLDSVADPAHTLLSFLGGQRIKTCKLRGVLSQGVLLPYTSVFNYMKNTLGMSEQSIQKVSVIGRDFKGILRVKRWYDESNKYVDGDSEPSNPLFQKYTDIEHLKNYTSVLTIGTPVQITEKLHGSSSRYALVEGNFIFGSRERQLKSECKGKASWWHFIRDKYNMPDLLNRLHVLVGNKNVALYGEIVGPGCQDLKYGQKELSFFAYDIIVDNNYIGPELFMKYCTELNIPTVPVLKVGTLQEEDFNLRLGVSVLDNSHVREGIVIKPLTPKYDPKLGRVILKIVSEDYLMRPGAKDRKDE